MYLSHKFLNSNQIRGRKGPHLIWQYLIQMLIKTFAAFIHIYFGTWNKICPQIFHFYSCTQNCAWQIRFSVFRLPLITLPWALLSLGADMSQFLTLGLKKSPDLKCRLSISFRWCCITRWDPSAFCVCFTQDSSWSAVSYLCTTPPFVTCQMVSIHCPGKKLDCICMLNDIWLGMVYS